MKTTRKPWNHNFVSNEVVFHLVSVQTVLYINLGRTSVALSNLATATALQTCCQWQNDMLADRLWFKVRQKTPKEEVNYTIKIGKVWKNEQEFKHWHNLQQLAADLFHHLQWPLCNHFCPLKMDWVKTWCIQAQMGTHIKRKRKRKTIRFPVTHMGTRCPGRGTRVGFHPQVFWLTLILSLKYIRIKLRNQIAQIFPKLI